MPKVDTSGKGNISECKVLMAYADAGFYTFVPFGSGAAYDLIKSLREEVELVGIEPTTS